ncbi:3-oxoacyl-[acyl-carrier-protein] synthase 2 [Streptomyces lucensis JCM 4490]|uniref:3-oxoacyl-[acyl-carrier-protein] synthase 2 n=1 Tax=Streptomyces lucensis JCM 4490 TaxID=1306176 RepID=A0A918J6P0_9ACTN|nr:beta-ketoacyl-ACP synthase II [Streptomyces lucensis]GGW53237.1 3-oxoacyl-[acyl-carrier-protein] synthase 2 [Streptomyces lucensis JCM 4490]
MPTTRTAGGRRVVITGWGAVTPLGLGVDETWSALVAGRSGIAPLTGVDTTGLGTTFGGEVKGFDPAHHLKPQQIRRMDAYAQYAYAAAGEAVHHAGLVLDDDSGPRAGVVIGSGYGPMAAHGRHFATLEESGPRRVSPFAQITGAIDSAACEIGFRFGVTGPTRALSTACASGADAIGEAAHWIRHGTVDVALAGGAEHILNRLDLASSGNARALSTRNDAPAEASRPFDTDRDGFVMSAGAGVLVLESAEHALARGATILAEVAGYASTSDAHHWTAPHPEGRGARAAMAGALADAGLTPGDVGYINAHGTSTQANDRTEVEAIRAVFGSHAEHVPISSTKSMTGHLIGAAGAVEAIAAGLAIRTSVVPPTINCHRPIDDALNFVPHQAQRHRVDVAMSNSFGFGGHNAVLVLRAWEADREQ